MPLRLQPQPVTALPVGSSFVKGFVVGGCLAAFERGMPAGDTRQVLRRALQGGAAVAAGEHAAAAVAQGRYGGALAAAAAGAAGVLLIERLLHDDAPPRTKQHRQEKSDGQEA
jgi:hypothetical protein